MLPGKGRSPVLQNTPLQWPGKNEIAHYGATRLGKTSLQTLSLLASNLYFLRIDLQVVFSGPKTPASSGWRGCVVFVGRQRRMTLLSQAVLIRSKLMCGWWPSSRSRTVAVLVRWATALKNSLVDFNRKTLVSIQPDSLILQDAPAGTPSVQLLYKFIFPCMKWAWVAAPWCPPSTVNSDVFSARATYQLINSFGISTCKDFAS